MFDNGDNDDENDDDNDEQPKAAVLLSNSWGPVKA